jgi:hypothetical protein
MIAGGVESMSRAPFVMGKAETAYARNAAIFDTTIGWRFVNPLMQAQYGIDSMPQTADNVAAEFHVSRADQDAFALRSQQRWAAAHAAGYFKDELVPVVMPRKKGDPLVFDTDEHPRPETTLGRERWSMRFAAGIQRDCRALWPHAKSACYRHGYLRFSASHYGIWASTCRSQGAATNRIDIGRYGCDRDQ